MKTPFLMLVALLWTMQAMAQINSYDKPSYSTFKPMSFQEMAAPAIMMRQKAAANAAYAEQLMDWMRKLKAQTTDQTFTSKITTLYNNTKSLYLNGDLARADKALKVIELNIREEIASYNERQQKRQATHQEQEHSGLNYRTLIMEAKFKTHPIATATILQIIPEDTRVPVLSIENDYYKVHYQNQTGYIHKLYFGE